MAGSNDFGITKDEAVSELSIAIEEAVNFLFSEFGDDWEKAEKYFAGQTDLPTVEGRSKVVKTEVRDSIRALKPSIMRTLLQARKVVEFIPNQIWHAELAEQQSVYATQTFWQNDGYKLLLSAVDESLKKKIGPVKVYWEEDPFPEYMKATGLEVADVQAIQDQPDIEIDEVYEVANPSTGEMTYDVDFYKYYMNGRIRMEAFPAVEFFINRNATGIKDATIHGHRRDVTVSEALELGLDFDDWSKLDADDPEQNEHQGESYERRRYQKNSVDDLESKDLANHLFLLTECYCSFDLEGTGQLQKYVFYLGGTGYTYLHHEKIEDWCIDLVEVDPVAFAPLGRSIADLTVNEQDMNTSVLRAIADNFHMANNPRYAANPMLTDFADLMNNNIGAPIKNKPGGDIQVVDIPFTGQQGLPFLQYLEMDVQNKVGVTKAATGLDPDAMQSTDKDAVRNTIMLGQGQVELIVRNIIETALIPVFKKLLRLSIRHLDRMQTIRLKGMVVPIDQVMIDPDLAAEPNVGLGTASMDQKMQGLMFILQKQEQTIQQMGLDNPVVGLSNIYNTLEDITELAGFPDVGRFFNMVTPELEKKLAEQRQKVSEQQQAMAQENQPMDPSKALMSIEGGKARLEQMKIMANRESDAERNKLEAIKFQEDADYKRDKLTQDRVTDLLKIQTDKNKAAADNQIKREQNRNQRLNVGTNQSGDASPPERSKKST